MFLFFAQFCLIWSCLQVIVGMGVAKQTIDVMERAAYPV